MGTLVDTKACRPGATVYTIHIIPVSQISAVAPAAHFFLTFFVSVFCLHVCFPVALLCFPHGGRRGAYRGLAGKPKGKRPLGSLGVDGTIILKWIFKKLNEEARTGP